MPRVISFGEEAAVSALEDAGFEVSTEEYQPSLGFGIVADQSPGGGDMAPIGSTVVISII